MIRRSRAPCRHAYRLDEKTKPRIISSVTRIACPISPSGGDGHFFRNDTCLPVVARVLILLRSLAEQGCPSNLCHEQIALALLASLPTWTRQRPLCALTRYREIHCADQTLADLSRPTSARRGVRHRRWPGYCQRVHPTTLLARVCRAAAARRHGRMLGVPESTASHRGSIRSERP